ncbi:hypothetical protein FCV65_12945 [Vibrio sp. F13]|nr:hypothetical protein FCV65_12945 [Vibrio sp. F13]
MLEKYNHFTFGTIRLFALFYKKMTLNILNIALLKSETPPLARAPHETNANFSGNANLLEMPIFLEMLNGWKY